MKTISEKKHTARELAAQFGCTVKTVHNHVNKLFGKAARNGITRTFDGTQVTALLESIKHASHGGRSVRERKSDLVNSLQGAETELTLDLQIAMAEKAAKELWKRKAEQNEARAVKAEAELGRLAVEYKDVLKANTQLFDIAVSCGTLTSDKEDMLALYRR